MNYADGGSSLAIGRVAGTTGVAASTLMLSDTGTVTQSQGIAVTGLALLGAGGSYTLTGSNSVGTLAATTGNVSFTDNSAFAVGSVTAGSTTTNGITTTGNVKLSTSGTISDPTAPVSVSGIFTLAGGSWSQNLSTLPSFTAYDFRISSGTFLRALGGTGSSGSPYQLTDVYGLQGVGTMLGSNFVLANNIDASGTAGGTTNTANWNSGAGFVPIGESQNFTGSLNGQSYSISNLYINAPSSDGYAGLFGSVSGAISNLNLANVTVLASSATRATGGLVGENTGTISNVTISGTVTSGGSDVGGLIGFNSGSVAVPRRATRSRAMPMSAA